MATMTQCDICGASAEGMFPENWLIFHTKPKTQGPRIENDLCPECKKEIPQKLLGRLEEQAG